MLQRGLFYTKICTTTINRRLHQPMPIDFRGSMAKAFDWIFKGERM